MICRKYRLPVALHAQGIQPFFPLGEALPKVSHAMAIKNTEAECCPAHSQENDTKTRHFGHKSAYGLNSKPFLRSPAVFSLRRVVAPIYTALCASDKCSFSSNARKAFPPKVCKDADLFSQAFSMHARQAPGDAGREREHYPATG
jgi:hypothetical protein